MNRVRHFFFIRVAYKNSHSSRLLFLSKELVQQEKDDRHLSDDNTVKKTVVALVKALADVAPSHVSKHVSARKSCMFALRKDRVSVRRLRRLPRRRLWRLPRLPRRRLWRHSRELGELVGNARSRLIVVSNKFLKPWLNVTMRGIVVESIKLREIRQISHAVHFF